MEKRCHYHQITGCTRVPGVLVLLPVGCGEGISPWSFWICSEHYRQTFGNVVMRNAAAPDEPAVKVFPPCPPPGPPLESMEGGCSNLHAPLWVWIGGVALIAFVIATALLADVWGKRHYS
jgi:hypothetical protein